MSSICHNDEYRKAKRTQYDDNGGKADKKCELWGSIKFPVVHSGWNYQKNVSYFNHTRTDTAFGHLCEACGAMLASLAYQLFGHVMRLFWGFSNSMKRCWCIVQWCSFAYEKVKWTLLVGNRLIESFFICSTPPSDSPSLPIEMKLFACLHHVIMSSSTHTFPIFSMHTYAQRMQKRMIHNVVIRTPKRGW